MRRFAALMLSFLWLPLTMSAQTLPPVIAKDFFPDIMPLNGSTSLIITIKNPNPDPSTSLTGIGFTDNLPAGLVVSTPNGLVNPCTGSTVTAAPGGSSVSFSGGTLIGADTGCLISLNVTGTSPGVKNNSVTVTSTNGGTGNTATASVMVLATPPSIKKSFGAATIPLNGGTSLTLTVSNPNTGTSLTGVGFTDNLPAGLVVSSLGIAGCGPISPTFTANPGATSVSMSGATIPFGVTTCIMIVNVTGTSPGVKNNSVQVTSTNGGTGNTATASVTVVAPPSISKSFGAASILLNGSTSLTFTITNPNTSTSLTGVAFTDPLPSGLVVATPNGLTNSCGGTVTAAPGGGSISLTGGTIASAGSCTLVVNVTGTGAGPQDNTTGNVTSTNGGTGNTASASVTVVAPIPPVISKSFGLTAIPVGATTSLSFTISNPNMASSLTVAFTDTLPAGLAVASPNGLTGSCGAGTITAVPGTSVISLSGGTIPATDSCTFSLNVVGTSEAAEAVNSVTVTSVEGGTGNTATATITVGAVYQITYASNLNIADSVLNLTNAGTLSGIDPAGDICVNVYAFDPAEELVACCSCLVTADGLNSLSDKGDLINNTLTPAVPTSIVVKLLATASSGGTCNPSSPVLGDLALGLRAWGTSLHALPTAPGGYATTEFPATAGALSPTELANLTSLCGFIQSNGSGFGICNSCRTGGLGGSKQ
jgi:hypothetical protein